MNRLLAFGLLFLFVNQAKGCSVSLDKLPGWREAWSLTPEITLALMQGLGTIGVLLVAVAASVMTFIMAKVLFRQASFVAGSGRAIMTVLGSGITITALALTSVIAPILVLKIVPALETISSALGWDILGAAIDGPARWSMIVTALLPIIYRIWTVVMLIQVTIFVGVAIFMQHETVFISAIVSFLAWLLFMPAYALIVTKTPSLSPTGWDIPVITDQIKSAVYLSGLIIIGFPLMLSGSVVFLATLFMPKPNYDQMMDGVKQSVGEERFHTHDVALAGAAGAIGSKLADNQKSGQDKRQPLVERLSGLGEQGPKRKQSPTGNGQPAENDERGKSAAKTRERQTSHSSGESHRDGGSVSQPGDASGSEKKEQPKAEVHSSRADRVRQARKQGPGTASPAESKSQQDAEQNPEKADQSTNDRQPDGDVPESVKARQQAGVGDNNRKVDSQADGQTRDDNTTTPKNDTPESVEPARHEAFDSTRTASATPPTGESTATTTRVAEVQSGKDGSTSQKSSQRPGTTEVIPDTYADRSRILRLVRAVADLPPEPEHLRNPGQTSESNNRIQELHPVEGKGSPTPRSDVIGRYDA